MRAFHTRIKLGGRASFSRIACARPYNVATRIFKPMTSVRYQSSDSSNGETVHWTPHAFNPFINSQDPSSIITSKTNDGDPKHTAYIALGSNLGDRINWIERACNLMSKKGIKVKRTSCLWETTPMYVTEQENFVNGACEVFEKPLSCKSRDLN